MKKENLHNIKQSGFKTPNAYFDTIEDQIMSQISLEKIDKNQGLKYLIIILKPLRIVS